MPNSERIISGATAVEPEERGELALVACGALLPEAIEAHRQLVEEVPGAASSC